MNAPAFQTVAISPANLRWQNGVPESVDFGDVYFSRDNGLEETRYVFLQNNDLDSRFRQLQSGDHFVIAETGFGTGLNFLAAWHLWRTANPPQDAVLHFVSVERFPLTPEDLQRAHQSWPELAELAAELQDNYPALVHGTHRLLLDNGRVRLTLFFGDALDGWQEMNFVADAWFLDGFAPSLNPELWVDELVSAVSRHSRPGTSVATFTAVGRVRRALIAAGFDMKKVPGFGRKREMLAGRFRNSEPDGELIASCTEAKHDNITDRIVIVGGGIGGSLLARNLAERGHRVTLLDAGADAAAGASGNQQGALYVKLGVEFNHQTQLALSALLFSQRYYRRFEGVAWFPSGVLQLAHNAQERQRQKNFANRNRYPAEVVRPVDAPEASELSGVQLATGGLWFPSSGWLKPALLCQQLQDHPNIAVRFEAKVISTSRTDAGWHLSMANGDTLDASCVVYCGGQDTPALLSDFAQFRFKAIRGQVTLLPEAIVQEPNCVICGNRYLNPPDQGAALTGATFDLHNDDPELRPESEQENLAELDTMIPGIFKRPLNELGGFAGRVGFRCTTHDYLPAAGALTQQPSAERASLFVLSGLGSKGLSYAPLLAEQLADEITGQPQALPGSLKHRLRVDRCRST